MPSLKKALSEYTLTLQANGRTDDTVKWYTSILSAMIQAMGNVDVSEVQSLDVTEYVVRLRQRTTRYEDAPQRPAQRGQLSDYTVQSHIRAIRAFWSFASTEYDLRNPARNLKTRKLPPPPPKAVQPRDVVRMLRQCPDTPQGYRDRAIILFLLDTGARVGGLVSVLVEETDFVWRRGTVHEKFGKVRTVYFTRYTASMMQRWLSEREHRCTHVFTSLRTGKALTTSGVYQVLKRLAKAAGVKSAFNPHAFRDGFAVQFIKDGGDIATLAKLLGHTDVNVTANHYAVFTDDELQTLKDEINTLQSVLGT